MKQSNSKPGMRRFPRGIKFTSWNLPLLKLPVWQFALQANRPLLSIRCGSLPCKRILTIALIALTQTACTVIPGSNLSLRGNWFTDDVPEGATPTLSAVQFYDINPTTLAYLNPPQPSKARTNPILEEQLASYQYYVAPGDVLTITVWDHPELTIPAGSFRTAAEGGNEVKADGTLFYAYAGDVQVAGKTTQQIKELLAAKLSKVIQSPQVDVRVAAFRSQKVYITGAVKAPGVQPITTVPLTIVEAIEQAGGLNQQADWERVTLTRAGATQKISLQELLLEGDLTKNHLLQHGDVIHIPQNDRRKVFVLGEVRRPGSVPVAREGLSLAEALSGANGIDEKRADGRGVYVLRNLGITGQQGEKPRYAGSIYRLNAKSAAAYLYADQFELKPRDVVYVSPAPITLWNRFLEQLVPSITSIENIGDIENN